MTVTGCHDCPLHRAVHNRYAECAAVPKRRERNHPGDYRASEIEAIGQARLKADWPEHERAPVFVPQWCPLNRAPFVVELKQ